MIELTTHKFTWDLGGNSVFLKVLAFSDDKGLVTASELKYRMSRANQYTFTVEVVSQYPFSLTLPGQ